MAAMACGSRRTESIASHHLPLSVLAAHSETAAAGWVSSFNRAGGARRFRGRGSSPRLSRAKT
jgi:hypothetical protein